MTYEGDDSMDGNQLCFFVDTTKCINCKTCEIACKDINDAAVGQKLRRVHTYEGGEYPQVFVCNISMACNHCEQPQCLAACPAGAYHKRSRDGLVVHDRNLCIGCKYCTWACPYAAPQYDAAAGKVMKCNMCLEQIDTGGKPACIQACPMRAIEVGTLKAIAERPGVTMTIRNLPSPAVSQPTTRYKVKPEMSLD